MRKEGFPGCVGFVDGTTIPMFQRLGFDGEVFFDRKKRYSLNAQIVCNCDKYITTFSTGWPGSTGDSKAYKRMQLHLDPTQFFEKGKLFIIFVNIVCMIHIYQYSFSIGKLRSVSLSWFSIQVKSHGHTRVKISSLQHSDQCWVQLLSSQGTCPKQAYNWDPEVTMELLAWDAIASLQSRTHSIVCCLAV